jgi:hypothetical protein
MRAVFEGVSTEGDDTLQTVQMLPSSGLVAVGGSPRPSTTDLRQD